MYTLKLLALILIPIPLQHACKKKKENNVLVRVQDVQCESRRVSMQTVDVGAEGKYKSGKILR